MAWNGLSVEDNKFRSGSGTDRIEGRFYGVGHKEVGGVFERNAILGGFGVIQVPQ